MCLFLRATAFDSFFLRAASTLLKLQMASSEHFRKIQMAGSKHFDYFVNFPLAGISLLLKGNVVLGQVTVKKSCSNLEIRTIGANLGRFNQPQKLAAGHVVSL